LMGVFAKQGGRVAAVIAGISGPLVLETGTQTSGYRLLGGGWNWGGGQPAACSIPHGISAG
jgi:hypothetical protein